jgi:NDP-sugar pyrophosphorylase family protein
MYYHGICMMKYKVLITTSGIGSRLGNITKFTNKSLVRVGDKPALSHIIEAHPADKEFVITVGHYADHIRQFLSLAYPDMNFTFVEVDNYDGPGSSLAYSLLQAEPFIDCPFIFHACDTILPEHEVADMEPTHNWMAGVCKDSGTEHYVSIDGQIENDNVSIINIRGKGDFDGDFNYIGLAGIHDYELFFKLLRERYDLNPNNGQLSDVDAIRAMRGEQVSFMLIELDDWYDIGNVASLQLTRDRIGSCKLNVLDKDNESIFIVGSDEKSIVKFFNNSTISKNRAMRAKSMGGLVPEITGNTDNFYKYDFVDGEVFAECISEQLFSDFLSWSRSSLWEEAKTDCDFSKICYDFYFTKTADRVNKFVAESGIKDVECIINGFLVPPRTVSW